MRVPEDTLEAIEEYREKNGLSKSQAGRELLVNGLEHERVTRENERLRRQLQAANSRQDDVGELVEYVEEERAMQQRERERRDAPLWTRAKWYVFGRSDEATAD